MLIRFSASTPMTPALAPASTASVKRRRLSIRSRARTMSSCWVRSSRVILLKVSPSWARSPSPAPDRHLHEQIAGRHDLRRIDQPADRRHQVIGEIEPDPDRDQQHDQRDHRIHQRECDLDAEPLRFELGILGDAGLRGAQLRDDLRVEDARDVEIGIGVGLQLDDGGHVIGVEKQRDLRLGLVAGGEHLARRLDEGLADVGAGLLDHVEIAVDHHDRRQAADIGLGGEELPELLAVLIEQRLGARHLDGGGDAVGAQELRVLAHIGVGDDQRILDQRLGLPREQPVEPAIERDARHHRHQDRRDRGDDREQADDAHMQPRGRPSPPAGLHDAPDLPRADRDQERDGDRVGERAARPPPRWFRRDRGEVGQHQEGREAPTAARVATAPKPIQRDHQPGAAAATVTISAVAAWPTVVMSWDQRIYGWARNWNGTAPERK